MHSTSSGSVVPNVAAPDLVRPAHLWVPERRTDSAGDEVVDFAETYGRIFDPSSGWSSMP
jgi:hypothetical protein